MNTPKRITKQNQTKEWDNSMSVSLPIAFFKRLTRSPLNNSSFSIYGIVVGIIVIVSLIIIG